MKNNEMTIEEQGIYRILCEKVGKRLLTQDGLYYYRDFRKAMAQIMGFPVCPNIASIYLSLMAKVNSEILSRMDDASAVRFEDSLSIVYDMSSSEKESDLNNDNEEDSIEDEHSTTQFESNDQSDDDFSIINRFFPGADKCRDNLDAIEDCTKTILSIAFDYLRLGTTEFKELFNKVKGDVRENVIAFSVTEENIDKYLHYVLEERLFEFEGKTKPIKEWITDFAMDSYEDQNENEKDAENEDIASIEEMRIEAILRMRKVIACSDIVDQFVDSGLPQVYEPPYGASYALEDDELQIVRNIEKNYDVLIWGVVRCGMTYNREPVTVDCMLFVSNCKDEWEEERKELYDGNPYVYTQMKEYNVRDRGYINVYASPGGTLLRK